MIINGWKEFFDQQNQEEYFQRLKAFLKTEYAQKAIYPPKADIMKCFEYTDFNEVKVVIIGQDPYYLPRQANGLCFSVTQGIPIPKSLINIYKELVSDVGITPPTHGDLSSWAKQGVLLLNTTLTVVANHPMSHVNQGWEIFTRRVIDVLNQDPTPKVFILWGKHAQNLEPYIHNPVHLILKSAHPSPLSAYNGFFGCRHFSKANRFLMENHRSPIDWQI